MRRGAFYSTEFLMAGATAGPGPVLVDGLVHSRKCALTTKDTTITGTRTDFQVLFTQANLPSEMFDADGAFPAQHGGGDIRFTSDAAGSSLMPTEVVAFITDNDPALGYAEIWVKFLSVSASPTTIYVWYNTPTSDSQPAVGAANGRNAVWSPYLLVTHDLITDSTGNFTLTPTAAPPASNPFGRADLGAKSFGVAVTHRVHTNLTAHNTQRTYQIWANRSGHGGANYGRLITKSEIPELSTESLHHLAGAGYEFVRVATSPHYGRWTYAAPLTGIWHRETVTYDSSDITNKPAAYRDGTQITTFSVDINPSEPTDAFVINAEPYVIGNDSTGQRHWDGQLCEVWISDAIRSAARIETEYSTQNNPAAFILVGTPQAP